MTGGPASVTAGKIVLPTLETVMMSSGEPGKIEKRMVVEYGIALDGVWLPLPMLRRLRAHGPWDAPFTEADADQERVLLQHALAERHNEAGLHRGTGLPASSTRSPTSRRSRSRDFATTGRQASRLTTSPANAASIARPRSRAGPRQSRPERISRR